MLRASLCGNADGVPLSTVSAIEACEFRRDARLTGTGSRVLRLRLGRPLACVVSGVHESFRDVCDVGTGFAAGFRLKLFNEAIVRVYEFEEYIEGMNSRFISISEEGVQEELVFDMPPGFSAGRSPSAGNGRSTLCRMGFGQLTYPASTSHGLNRSCSR